MGTLCLLSRLCLLLVFSCCCANAKSLDFGVIPNSAEHLNVFDEDVTTLPLHVRFKRAVYAALGLSNLCEAGWTGQFCENPICDETNVPPIPGDYSNIDILFLNGSCGGNFYVPIDYASSQKEVDVSVTASGVPYINLTDVNGNIISPATSVSNDGYSMARYAGLKAGGYSLTVDNGNVPTASCVTTSSLRIVNGWVVNPHHDAPPNAESAYEMPMYFVAHAVNLNVGGQVGSVTIRPNTNMRPIYRAAMTKRYNCGYEFYAGEFTCSKFSTYYYHVDGLDSQGFPFRRTARFSCLEVPTTVAPPTTTPKPIQTCYNNGTLLRPGGNNATCFCPELYSGRQCEKVNCMNGGAADTTGLECVCVGGFQGINCQDVTCEPNWGPFLTDYKTLVVIIHNVASMAQYVPSIAKAIDLEVQHNQVLGQDVYRGYILVKFANNDYTTQQYTILQYDQFLSDLNMTSNTQGGCNDTTFEPIASVFNTFIYNKSPLYLFTDVIPADPDKWQLVTESNTRAKMPIYCFFFNQSTCPADPLSEPYRMLQQAVFLSTGLMLTPTPTFVAPIVQTVVKATTYRMNMVITDDLQKCATPGYRVFFVDSSTTSIVIMAVGESLVLSVTDPNGATNTLQTIINSGGTYLYEIINPVVGEHLLTLTSTNMQSFCTYRVFARSSYDFFLGTTDTLINDAMDSEPVLGQPNHFVAQLNGLYNAAPDPFKLYAELLITTNFNNDNKYQKPMFYSNGVYRSGCGYHLYFGVANFCEFINQPFYATIFADDGQGFTIMRTTVGYCSATFTTQYPPNTCQNGGVPDPTNNSTCICPAGFRGNYCQDIVCQNGGTPRGSQCSCVAGTGGTFCELYACTQMNTQPNFNFGGRSMTFVLSARTSMQDALNMISANVQIFTRDVQVHSPDWIKSWILIYTNNNASDVIVRTSVPSEFVAAVQNMAANLSQFTVPEADCSVKLEQALYYAALLSEQNSYVYAFADSYGMDTDSYLALYDIVTQYRVQINLIGVKQQICTVDGSGVFPDYLTSLALSTFGDVYMTTQLNKIMAYIVGGYHAGVSYAYGQDDCTSGAQFYMPIDGWTQGFTLAAIGKDLANMTVTFPDGSPTLHSNYEIVLIDESETKINQYLPPCPGKQWTYKEQQCLMFEPVFGTWIEAWRRCHEDMNGFMVDVANDDINQFLQFNSGSNKVWIGLVYNGNGQWVWDVPDGNMAQPLGDYHPWAPGVDPNNPAYNYVVQNEQGQWEPAPANGSYYYACQRHRYGQDYYPGEGTGLIPSGRWKVNVKTNSGGCLVQARSQSEIQVFFGFVSDPHSDFPQMFANSQSQSNYMVAYASGIAPFNPDVNPTLEGRLNYALVGYNQTLTDAVVLNNRWFCSYPMVSQPFVCPNAGSMTDLYVSFTGIDQFGNTFQRYSETICAKYVLNCNNHGYVNNGICQCDPYWSGPTCNTPICQNDGIVRLGQCQCQPQFTGTFCEHAMCEPPYPATFKDTGRTLAIVLETSYNMGATIFQLRRSINASLNAINSDPTTAGWFTNYVLYPFDSGLNRADWYPVVDSTNPNDIVNAIGNIQINSCPGSAPCSTQCPRPIYGVLADLLNRTSFAVPNSVILVITRSSPEDYLTLNQLSSTLQNAKAYLNFIYTNIDSPCGMGWNGNDALSLFRAVSYSSGNVFTMSAVDLSQNFLMKYIPSIYQSAGLNSVSGDCNGQEMLFQVEHEMYEFTLHYYVPQSLTPITVTLYNPKGQQIALPQNIITSDTNYVGVIRVNDTIGGQTLAGTYRVVTNGGTGNLCYFSARGRTSIEVYIGYVSANSDQFNGATNDNAHYAPVVLESTTIVVHAEGLGSGRIEYVQIVAAGYGLVHTSEMRRRDSACSYEYYSTLPFYTDYYTFLVVIYGVDDHGAYFSRTFQTTCVGSRPNRKPPPASCPMGQVKMDAVFLIDSSMAATNFTFKQLSGFAASSMQPYNFTYNLTQVAAVSLANTAQGGFGFFASDGSYDNVYNLFSQLSYLGVDGQNLTAGIEYVINTLDRPAQGYRTDPDVKHLLFYLTASNPTDPDPALLVNSLKRSGLYGFAILAYNLDNPSSALTNLVIPDCFYQSPSYEDLMNYGTNFVQGITCSRVNICNS